MSVKEIDLRLMSLDELWALHEELGGILAARIEAEKRELEKRLAVLSRSALRNGESDDSRRPPNAKPRRKYPRVLPKYRNPKTSETWSGRGKLPRWLVAAMKSGKKIEEFRIGEGASKARQRE
jgi:DNA-binding protein H-NS